MQTTKNAFIHIGTHKTASTFLQKFLLLNRKLLQKSGVYIPLLDRSIASSWSEQKKNGDHKFHLPIAGALKPGISSDRFNMVFDNLKKLIQENQNADILLSSEVFEDRLSKKNIDFLENFFSTLGYKVTFIAYIRNQPEYINSRYTQTLKRFWDDCSIEEYIQQAYSMSIFDYGRLFSEILNNKKVLFSARSYDLASKKGIEKDILDVILRENCYDYSQFRMPTRIQNQAPGPITVFIAAHIRKNILAEFPNQKKLFEFGKHLTKISKANKWNTQKYMGLTNTDARRIEQNFRLKNDRFSQTVWGTNWEDQFIEKQFEQNIFDPQKATKNELWTIDCAIDYVLNVVRKQNDDHKNFDQYVKYISRRIHRHYRYL